MHMALSALLLGVINIAIVVAILVLIGYIIVWVMGLLGFPIPQMVQRIFMAIVALIALYMFVALLLGYGVPGPILLR
jgi:D-ribose pyranose/furanose isomerase RbsD